MGNWKERYESKLCTSDEAIKKIAGVKRIIFEHACGESILLTEALMKNKELFKKTEIIHLVAMGKGEYAKEENSEYFRHNALFAGGTTREAANSSYGDYTPSFFFEMPELFKKGGVLNPDVTIIQVSYPDEHGYCSYGISCDYTKCAAENSNIVIAQVNKFMPRTLGNCFIHIDNIDYIVEQATPIIELKIPVIGEIEKRIGEYCASLIDDGATLQLGIGAIPDAVLTFLRHKKDLGIHSEMISDGVVDLVNLGVITNKRKNIDTGKSIIALPSTAAKGTISKIVFTLDEGAAVTTSRNDVDYIITEYGIAHLKGKSLRERAKALIEIAHPDFREELRKKAVGKFGAL